MKLIVLMVVVSLGTIVVGCCMPGVVPLVSSQGATDVQVVYDIEWSPDGSKVAIGGGSAVWDPISVVHDSGWCCGGN